ncbi:MULTISPECIES: hypothetical protein [unclassified Acinetobacter]|uniref:hypothetical protein n=1 Tax=unclassified Acinetobacter TaxID=196816 RepID=UPI0015D3217F|nr:MULTISPECIES: hypothetical protein [unclassified Acinetobacter]
MKIKEGGGMDIQKEREGFENHLKKMGKTDNETFSKNEDDSYQMDIIHFGWKIWQAAKVQAVPAQLDVNSILHDIDCYFDNGLSNTERAANNLLQSIYEKLSGEVKAQEPAND